MHSFFLARYWLTYYANKGSMKQKKFSAKYGLSPVEYIDFNQTVIFQIENEELFENFKSHLSLVINSTEGTIYENQPYNLISLIYKFSFFDSNYRINTNDVNYVFR